MGNPLKKASIPIAYTYNIKTNINNLNLDKLFEKELLNKELKEKILYFLKGFNIISVASPTVYDWIKRIDTKINYSGFAYKKFYWESIDIYYFENYDLKLIDVFKEEVSKLSIEEIDEIHNKFNRDYPQFRLIIKE